MQKNSNNLKFIKNNAWSEYINPARLIGLKSHNKILNLRSKIDYYHDEFVSEDEALIKKIVLDELNDAKAAKAAKEAAKSIVKVIKKKKLSARPFNYFYAELYANNIKYVKQSSEARLLLKSRRFYNLPKNYARKLRVYWFKKYINHLKNKVNLIKIAKFEKKFPLLNPTKYALPWEMFEKLLKKKFNKEPIKKVYIKKRVRMYMQRRLNRKAWAFNSRRFVANKVYRTVRFINGKFFDFKFDRKFKKNIEEDELVSKKEIKIIKKIIYSNIKDENKKENLNINTKKSIIKDIRRVTKSYIKNKSVKKDIIERIKNSKKKSILIGVHRKGISKFFRIIIKNKKKKVSKNKEKVIKNKKIIINKKKKVSKKNLIKKQKKNIESIKMNRKKKVSKKKLTMSVKKRIELEYKKFKKKLEKKVKKKFVFTKTRFALFKHYYYYFKQQKWIAFFFSRFNKNGKKKLAINYYLSLSPKMRL